MLKHLTNSTQILTFNAFNSLAGGTQQVSSENECGIDIWTRKSSAL